MLAVRPTGKQRHEEASSDPRHTNNTQDGIQDLFGSKVADALCDQGAETVVVMITHDDPRCALALHRENRKIENTMCLFKFASPLPASQVKYGNLAAGKGPERC
jgi:hypothetical protein